MIKPIINWLASIERGPGWVRIGRNRTSLQINWRRKSWCGHLKTFDLRRNVPTLHWFAANPISQDDLDEIRY